MFPNIIPAYVYVQYNDDVNILAFFQSYNDYAQQYLNTVNLLSLSVYTNSVFSGVLLDWVVTGIYGIPRPNISNSRSQNIGPFNTYMLNTIMFAAGIQKTDSSSYIVTDDIYKRCVTWRHYKGDGPQFTIPWLKRRIVRFLGGANGTDVSVGDTGQIGVQIASPIITITIYTGTLDVSQAQVFANALAAGVLPIPFQYSVVVNIPGTPPP